MNVEKEIKYERYGKRAKQGISLITLIITIIVVIILAAVIILSLSKNNPIDSAVKARFMNDFREVQSGVDIYSVSNYASLLKENKIALPIDGKLTLEDKEDISKNVPTLKTKIEELSGKSLNDVNLYWINEEKAGVSNLRKEKKAKGYIIDVDTRQIYDYVGDSFEGKRWHTLDGGVSNTDNGNGNSVYNGWIKLTLYYPEKSTQRQWRLGSANEIRGSQDTVWQDYTGPIYIPINRIKDVWIRYFVAGKETTVPPEGKPLVDIEQEVPSKSNNWQNVKINYQDGAITKQYRIDNGQWQDYNGDITVNENCLIEAKVVTEEKVYDENNNLKETRHPENYDYYRINISAPNINKLETQKAKDYPQIEITYPDSTPKDKKYYAVDTSSEQIYKDKLNITSWGQEIKAYYYDKYNIKSPEANLKVEEPALEAPKLTKKDADTSVSGQKAKVAIEYADGSVKKVYRVNNGDEQEYNGEISVTEYNTTITAYSYSQSGKKSNEASITISQQELPAPTFDDSIEHDDSVIKKVKIIYPDAAENKTYIVDNGQTQSYTDGTEISLSKDGSTIEAYYFNALGDKSQIGTYIAKKEEEQKNNDGGHNDPPDDLIPAPQIGISPTEQYQSQVSVAVSIPSGYTAENTYIELGENNGFEKYTSPVTVTKNMKITAYYKVSGGKESLKAYANVGNIGQKDDKPILSIEQTPNEGPVDSVTINEKSPNADKLEYSLDGINYQEYTSPVIVKQNIRYYARATNSYGVTDKYIDITIIGKKPQEPAQYSVAITADPDSSTTSTKVDKVKVSIAYDKRAQQKTYKIDSSGELQNYTGEFYVDKNCTIYAYALTKQGDTILGKGDATKAITNTNDGIIQPQITSIPDASIQSSKVKISIKYDDNATVKKYSIDGGTLQDYTDKLEISKNGTVIYAYNENSKGQKADSTYTVSNITPIPPTLLLDMGEYYLIKLNYPEGTTNHEYKWTESGTWKTYNEDYGFILVKPQYKDEIIKNGVVIKIQNENGEYVEYKGDWYLVTMSFEEISDSLFMKWDSSNTNGGNTGGNTGGSDSGGEIPTLDNPKIAVSPTAYTTQGVKVTISYPDAAAKKEYKIGDGAWQDYTQGIDITDNCIVYARATDSYNNTSVSDVTITNIDKQGPTVSLSPDGGELSNITAKISVTDDKSGVNASTLQYIWDTQNTTTPAGTWTNFNNNDTVSKEAEYNDSYYLWIKATDNLGNETLVVSNKYTKVEEVVMTEARNENLTYLGTQDFAYNNPVIPAGFVAVDTPDAKWEDVSKSNTDTSASWNQGLVIEDSAENQFVWVPVDGSNVKYQKDFSYPSYYGTPSLNTSDDTFPYGEGSTNLAKETTQITKYQGFYIARYEASNNGSSIPASKKAVPWVYITYAEAKSYSESIDKEHDYDTSKIGTNLVTGTEWDTTMKWIQNTKKYDVSSDSGNWGNYYNSVSPANVSGYGNLRVTGYSENWKAKNIYDLAGNVREWTNEKRFSNGVNRGGSYGDYGSYNPAAYRNDYYDSSSGIFVGFRIALYIK